MRTSFVKVLTRETLRAVTSTRTCLHAKESNIKVRFDQAWLFFERLNGVAKLQYCGAATLTVDFPSFKCSGRKGESVLKAADSGNAVAAALARLVADGIVLRVLTELFTWHHDEKIITPTPNRLFVDQVFLAVGTYLVSKCGGQQQLDSRRGCLTPRQEKIAKEFLDANIQNNVSLEYVARLCNLSPAHFARLFRRTAGVTPYQWFVHRRLAQAKRRLRQRSG
jgi:hypothetical protein